MIHRETKYNRVLSATLKSQTERQSAHTYPGVGKAMIACHCRVDALPQRSRIRVGGSNDVFGAPIAAKERRSDSRLGAVNCAPAAAVYRFGFGARNRRALV